jgi:two-component system NarL family sensor kinase
MIKAFVLLYFLCISARALPQRVYTLGDDRDYIDSLKMLVARTSSDSICCATSYRLADLLRRTGSPEEAKPYFARANELSVKFPYLRDASIFYNATSYITAGDYSAYEKQLLLANSKLKAYPTKNAYGLRAFILQNLAIVNQINQNEKGAMRIIVTEAIPLAKQSGNNEVLSSLYRALGIIFMNYPDRKKADMYLKLSIDCLESKDNGSPTLKESKVETYSIHAENLVQLGRMYEAKHALDKAFQILKNYPASNLNNLYYCSEGLYYYKSKRLKNAYASYDKGIRSSGQTHDILAMNRLMYMKYKALCSEKKYEAAKQLLLELVNSPSLFVIDQKNWYKELAEVYELLGDIKNANHYNKLYIDLNDSLHKTSFEKEIGQMEARFHKAESDNTIRQLEEQRERMRLVAENNKLHYGIFGLACLILFSVLVLFWIRANSQKKLAQEKAKNYQQSLLSLGNQKEMEILQATIAGEEVERKRIARDLHDGIGSLLSSLKMKLIKRPNSLHELNEHESEQVAILLNRSITELRQIAYNLVPETLLKLGLEKALQDLCLLLKTDHINIIFHAQGIKPDISESNQMIIYRIIQELINNALKHSHCTEIIVDCSQNENLFFITVEDNGKGFDASDPKTLQGSGLRNLKNRVEFLKGKLQIDSSPGEGTAFNIELNI